MKNILLILISIFLFVGCSEKSDETTNSEIAVINDTTIDNMATNNFVSFVVDFSTAKAAAIAKSASNTQQGISVLLDDTTTTDELVAIDEDGNVTPAIDTDVIVKKFKVGKSKFIASGEFPGCRVIAGDKVGNPHCILETSEDDDIAVEISEENTGHEKTYFAEKKNGNLYFNRYDSSSDVLRQFDSIDYNNDLDHIPNGIVKKSFSGSRSFVFYGHDSIATENGFAVFGFGDVTYNENIIPTAILGTEFSVPLQLNNYLLFTYVNSLTRTGLLFLNKGWSATYNNTGCNFPDYESEDNQYSQSPTSNLMYWIETDTRNLCKLQKSDYPYQDNTNAIQFNIINDTINWKITASHHSIGLIYGVNEEIPILALIDKSILLHVEIIPDVSITYEEPTPSFNMTTDWLAIVELDTVSSFEIYSEGIIIHGTRDGADKTSYFNTAAMALDLVPTNTAPLTNYQEI